MIDNIKFSILFILIVIVQTCFGQTLAKDKIKLDSLFNIVNNKNSHDTIKVNSYLEMANLFYHDNPDTAIYFCEKAFKIAKNNNYIFGLGECYGWLGYLMEQKNDIGKALEYYNESIALNIEVNDTLGLAINYGNIALLYEDQGLIQEAIDYHHKSIKLKEKIDDKSGLAYSYNNIGYLHFEQEDVSTALEYYDRSLKLLEQIDDKMGMAGLTMNIGAIYSQNRNFDSALEYYLKSFQLYKEVGDKRDLAISYSNIGYIYGEINKPKLALEYYLKGLEIREEMNIVGGKAYSNNQIGNLYLLYYSELGYTKKEILPIAKKYLLDGYRYANEINLPREISNSAAGLNRLYKIEGDFQKALEFYELSIEMRDSINNKKNQKAVIKQQTKYEYEKQKAIDDKENEKKVALEKQKQKDQFIVLIIVVIAAALVLILLLIIYRRLQLTRKQKLIIEEQKEEVESQRDQIEEQRDDIVASINYAKRIQEAILPSLSTVKQYIPESFILYKPKDVVAGDFYWQEIYKGKVYVAAADCTGHGVPGAMVSVVCSNALSKALLEDGITDVGKILDKTREIVISKLAKSSDIKDGMDISLACFDFDNMKLEWSGANNPVYLLRDQEIEVTKGDREAIGYTDNPTPFTKHTFDLKKGDTIYLFTDGYADQFGGKQGKKMGYKNFRDKLIELSTLEMENQNSELENYFEEWKGSEEQVDDVCVIGIKI